MTSLTEILAWKAGRHEINRGESAKLADVAVQCNIWKATSEDLLCVWLDLGQKNGLVPGQRESSLNAADAGKKAHDTK